MKHLPGGHGGSPHARACLREQAEEIAGKLRRHQLAARTVQVKVRYGDFTTLTRQHSPIDPLTDSADLFRLGCWLLGREKLVHRPLRLLGLGVSGLLEVPASNLPSISTRTAGIVTAELRSCHEPVWKSFQESFAGHLFPGPQGGVDLACGDRRRPDLNLRPHSAPASLNLPASARRRIVLTNANHERDAHECSRQLGAEIWDRRTSNSRCPPFTDGAMPSETGPDGNPIPCPEERTGRRHFIVPTVP